MRTEVIGDATLYCGDCREILPTLEKDIVCISDPPYGIGFRYNTHKDVGGDEYMSLLSCLDHRKKILLQYPEEMMKYMVPLWGAPDDCYTWCYNSNTNRQSRIWGFWGVRPDWNALKQPCKNPTDKRVNQEVRSYDWCCDVQQVKNVSKEKTDHPCQIPEELMRRVILLSGCDTVCDPFMGSCSTGAAAIRAGRKFIGCEISPEYFDIACKRIEAAQRQGGFEL
jgi:DNA modification methylase